MMLAVVAGAWIAALSGGASARALAPAEAAGEGTVNLPYQVNDNQGNQWFIYQGGQFQQQGNMPVYGQGGMIRINNAFPQQQNNQAKLDAKTGELIVEEMSVGGLNLTRRILINKEEGRVRYIDIIKNTQNRDQIANITFSSNVNYGVQFATLLPDPRRKEQNLAWIAQTHANGQVVLEMFGGKGAKSVPTFRYQQGNNSVSATLSQNIAPGKEIAVMHFHGITASQDAASRFVLGMKETRVLASIPTAIRRLIVNFLGGENFIGDYEILRGETLDVVELRSGDLLKGTLKETAYTLDTFYGVVNLPPTKVIGLINAGEFRPRQLVVTRDGEIFGGKLERENVALELSSGQVMEIPLSQVSRVGCRKQADEPEEWTFDKPIILMRSGDRISVQLPAAEIEFVTRYGRLMLKPQSIAAIELQAEEHGVHEVFLTDGSRFAGLVTQEVFALKLADAGAAEVKFPASSIRRIQFAARPDEIASDQATLSLSHEDLMVGRIVGTLKLDTAFDTLNINAAEVKRLAHAGSAPSQVQVTLWDDTTVSGQLEEPEVVCQLRSEVSARAPVALIEEYSQPRPQPSPAVIETIKLLVTDLGAADWKQRDHAQEKLVALGPAILATLKQLRPAQGPEAQQRIDGIVQRLEKDLKQSARTPPGAAGASMVPPPPMMNMDDVQMEQQQPGDQ
jgi:hypothetical protein